MSIKEFLDMLIQYDRETYFAAFGEIEKNLGEIEESLKQYTDDKRETLLWEMVQYVEKGPKWVSIHVLSFAMQVDRKPEFAERLLKEVLEADWEEVGEYNKLSHYWQISTKIFEYKNLDSFHVQKNLKRLYRLLTEAFAETLGVRKKEYIPIQERNEDLVFVFTAQLLGMEHAPTKTLLDRCYVLQKYLRKKVFVINTVMQVTTKGMAPFYLPVEPEYKNDLLGQTELEFRGEKFELYQCENIMPDLNIMQHIIEMIREKRPYYLLHIGGSDICADICGRLIPQITISTVFSQIAASCGEYQIVDRNLTQEDVELLDILGVSPQNVKRTPFTFSFKQQLYTFSREELRLWGDRFVLVIVGWRLAEEIDGDFLKMLEHLVRERKDIGIAFAGKFDNYEKIVENNTVLKQSCMNLGSQTDMLAVVEKCDLYVNPKRNGGGSSASEALYKGLPVVTLPTGDVSVAAGAEFCVNDYNEMERMILRYISEEQYYKEMSQKAKKRAEYLMDSKTHFGKVIKEIEMDIRSRE